MMIGGSLIPYIYKIQKRNLTHNPFPKKYLTFFKYFLIIRKKLDKSEDQAAFHNGAWPVKMFFCFF